jgi:murein hydrolase activator
MQKKWIYTLLLVLCAGTSALVYAQRKSAKKTTVVNQQSKEDLEAQRITILAEIKQTQEQLKTLQKDKNATLQQLAALQNKLQARQALINNINNEIGRLQNDIEDATNDVDNLKMSLNDLKKHYAELIRYSYKQRTSQDMVMFIFSSKTFYEASRRYKYVKQYRDYRKQQAEKILATSRNINNKILTLEEQKKQKDVFLRQQEEQKQVLALETSQKNSVVVDLKGKEKDLQAKVAGQRKIAESLSGAIAAAIRREIEIARKKAMEERKRLAAEKAERERRAKEEALARKRREEAERKQREEEERKKTLEAIASKKNNKLKTTKGGNAPDAKAITSKGNIKTTIDEETAKVNTDKPTPRYIAKEEPSTASTATVATTSFAEDMGEENRQLSANFESNRGVLSAPASGYICEHFGKNKHPVYSVVTENYGIDIRTSRGAQVRTVFGGEVISVFYLAGAGVNIMVNHGSYFTVYSKIEKATVSKGQKVTARQNIGTVMADADGNSQVHFEIWKVGANGAPQKINPEQWIRM